jgi:hypothetical protein
MSRRKSFRLLVAAIAAVCMMAFSDGLFAQGRSEAAFERVKEVQERHTDSLMAETGVVGTAIGEGQGAQPIVLVLVEHGAVANIPEQLEGVPVRALITGKIYALPQGGNPDNGKGKPDGGKPELDPTSRWPRAVPIGVSTGHPAVTAGTLGCRVKDGLGNVYALSNNHIYANQNRAGIGDPVIQPGTYDGGESPADSIGTLFDYEPIVFSTGANNVIDAAIALSVPELLDNATPSDGYGLPKSTTATVSRGAKVMKYGRTTGQTSGMVKGTNVIVNVQYEAGYTARFVGQILIGGGNFSAGGDSGSLVVLSARGANDRKPVGLLFAGGNHFAIANPIDAVLTRFNVTIDGE